MLWEIDFEKDLTGGFVVEELNEKSRFQIHEQFIKKWISIPFLQFSAIIV